MAGLSPLCNRYILALAGFTAKSWIRLTLAMSMARLEPKAISRSQSFWR